MSCGASCLLRSAAASRHATSPFAKFTPRLPRPRPNGPPAIPKPHGEERWLCATQGLYQLTVKKNLGAEPRVGRFLARARPPAAHALCSQTVAAHLLCHCWCWCFCRHPSSSRDLRVLRSGVLSHVPMLSCFPARRSRTAWGPTAWAAPSFLRPASASRLGTSTTTKTTRSASCPSLTVPPLFSAFGQVAMSQAPFIGTEVSLRRAAHAFASTRDRCTSL